MGQYMKKGPWVKMGQYMKNRSLVEKNAIVICSSYSELHLIIALQDDDEFL